jgi:hypothetical protein
VSGHYDLLRIVGVGIAVIAVFFTGFDLVPVLIIGALLALYLWAISAARGRSEVTEADVEPEHPTETRAK